jgi:hypothetical protein
MLAGAFVIVSRLKAAIERKTDGLRSRITSCGSLAIYGSVRAICGIWPNPQRLWETRTLQYRGVAHIIEGIA